MEEGGVNTRDPSRIAPRGMRRTGAAAPVFCSSRRSSTDVGARLFIVD
jgi:hypothetical protein